MEKSLASPRKTVRQAAVCAPSVATAYAVSIEDGSFVQFELDSSKKAVPVRNASTKVEHLRPVADGTREGALFHSGRFDWSRAE
jgi:hypothetical protein